MLLVVDFDLDPIWHGGGGSKNHTCKKFLALLAVRGEYSFSSDTFVIILSQSEATL